MRLIESLCSFYLVLRFVSGFNFFPKHAQVFSNNIRDSYFGYSVLLQADVTNSNKSRIVVGSPKANLTRTPILQGLNEPGAVYSCLINEQSCEQFLLFLKGNEVDQEGVHTYHSRRDHGWLGAAIDGLDVAQGKFVACAPRWINQYHKTLYYLQNGACYYLEDSANIERINAKQLLPLISQSLQGKFRNSTKQQVYNYALGEAGMSVHFAKGNSELLFGAPGLMQWRGMVGNYKIINFPSIPDPDKVQKLNDFSYFGYSISSGIFSKSNQTWYVGGAPRGQNLLGQVLIFDYALGNTLTIYYEMKGQQEGEYFGSSLSVGDFNNDGFDDIIIGSPMYSPENFYDVGCVYVYINFYDENGSFESTVLHPPMPKNGIRFGTAVQAIGDVNKDGFQDVAVGAPYEDNGVVYIYLGTSSGVSEQYSQRIVASEISSALRGFGNSFSRGVDIDNNNYNDLAIGSYLSNQVILLKSRPVVSIYSSLKSDRTQISITVNSFKIYACIKYAGVNLPPSLNVKTTITADDFYKRVNFKQSRGSSWEIVKDIRYNYNEEKCEEYEVVIDNKQSDFTQPIEFKMTYELVDPPQDDFCATCPVIDKKLSNYTTLRIPYETGCKDICKPNLRLTAKHDKSLVIGAHEKTDIAIKLENLADPAFGCRLYAEIPSMVAFLRVPINCQNVNDNVLICDMGNPVKQNDMKSLILPIDVSMLGTQDKLTIKLTTNSSGEEVDDRDNSVTLEISLKTEVSISVIGISNPEQYNFIEQGKVKHPNLTFTQQYTVQNLGPSSLNDLELTFLIPLSHVSDDTQVIKVYSPETQADGTSVTCTLRSPHGFYNPDKFIIPNNEAEEPTTNSRLSRAIRRSDIAPENDPEAEEMNLAADNPLVAKVLKLMASDRPLPEDLQENRTLVLGPREGVELMEVRCTTGLLKKNSKTVIGFKMIADLIILDEKRENKDTIVITSSVQPTSRHFIVNKTYTHTILQGNAKPGSVWQWILLGLVLGMVLLTLIVFGLYKAGFFKRKIPREKLNEETEIGEEITLQSNSN